MPEVTNQQIIEALEEIKGLLGLKKVSMSTPFRLKADQKAIDALKKQKQEIALVYKEKGLKGIKEILGVGDKNAQKIEELLKKGKIKQLEELKEETAIQQIITFYFQTKNISLEELKKQAKKQKIVYSRYTKPAKQLLELAGSIDKAKQAIKTVSLWANSRNLDYSIETTFKKWLELDKLKPKEIIKKPFYEGKPMFFSQTKKKWFVIADNGEWLEFCDKMDKIEWKIS
ncbi:hypothetical protein COX24_01900 [bacterium (Candidatus Gribaldobacteria) CG23_combo_of_CG06-09_8_20_14_all_37_87_8]|uniref:Crossover junction endonuclease MUS81-like HHH domain-containing protein n=2 Tax=Candidatus Gribaldobacteria TaxID=2798536 RepID=A0A2G9ZGQ1_9BACT|nr:MAG: hypothetical protein AUJ25_00135 [Parcubacteria group bacterium CG1_02_37_13]PIP31750.1 MAG: hypothetical protein COX24_01900 [bacterium (Candidatus Gribaldobacteria) CG23_combo_of_CG06-09_8_20_14_all_37_87_8]PIR90519.1 MAG: hypothetical protein COU05_01560 [bacterium (Candidatus Gribaldobacteria) CG10_big_fil_rev_8_21_14_0_10_37_21]